MQLLDNQTRLRRKTRQWRTLPTLLLLAACITTSAFAAPPARSPEAALADGLRPSVLGMHVPLPQWSIETRMAEHKVPGTAVAVIRDGKVVYAQGFGLRQAGTQHAVDGDTLFSVASISKVVTAAATLREVADGRLDLDRSANTYLKSWKIPAGGGFNPDAITLRMLMSHTAGLTVWGFEDYQPGEPLPTIVQTLDGIKPAKNAPVRVDFAPGKRMRYSGGGITIEQLLLQDTTGKPLETIARQAVFKPVGMKRSTFTNPLPPSTTNVAHAHDGNGQPAALPIGRETFPEQAASGLWTSANDLGAFVAALLNAYRGQDAFLPQPLAIDMMTEVAPSQHGLGPRLEGEGISRIFQHGGTNDSYRAWIEGYPATGDGFVILTNGSNGGKLAAEIRNALSDVFAAGSNPVLRTIELPASALAGFAGEYELQTDLPGEVTGNMTDIFDHDRFTVSVAQGALSISDVETTRQLQPLTPTRFVNPAGDAAQPRYEFLRDASGKVHTLLVHREGGRLYFHKRAPSTAH